jgi:pyrimidine-nucleoside phosphorylase
MYEIIRKTKHKVPLTAEEIRGLVNGYVSGSIPDYQVSAWLMAVNLNSLTDEETLCLTTAMRDSGDVVDLGAINGVTVDKHSTGGVGDKTSLIIGPVVASCGVSVPKMSGKGLGHTGGTIDKLESIPGCRTDASFDEFIRYVQNTGFSIVSQSGNLVPADKKLYALRDATATVDSIPLIASSIMSKKLAMGADCILLDVKTGSGAFMKTVDDARSLASLMVETGKNAGKKCMAVITDMDIPLGKAIGNSLEIIEVTEILKNNVRGKLYELCIELSADMLMLAGKGTREECRRLSEEAISSGRALDVFRRSIEQQGGDIRFIEDYSVLGEAAVRYDVLSPADGYICSMDSEEIGLASLALGAGRKTKEAAVDYTAGIVLDKEYGEFVKKGEKLMTLYTSSGCDMKQIEEKVLGAIGFSDEAPSVRSVVVMTVE